MNIMINLIYFIIIQRTDYRSGVNYTILLTICHNHERQFQFDSIQSTTKKRVVKKTLFINAQQMLHHQADVPEQDLVHICLYDPQESNNEYIK